MHDGPIVIWRNGDPIAPVVVSDDDADASVDDDITPDPPLFLSPPPLPLMKLTSDAPLQVVLVDVGAGNDQGASVQQVPDQQALAPTAEDEEIEGEVYKAIDDKCDTNVAAGGDAEGAPCYNLRWQQPPPFVSYNNPNGIEDLDLGSSSFDVSISIDDDTTEEVYDAFAINLTQIPVAESSRAHFQKWRQTQRSG